MTVISKYPVFEADQVLSQSHLNSIVSYLETQDRATRKGLIGIGIVCGLEVSFPSSNKIKIACGTAITSLGFQINWEEKTFSKYKVIDKLSDAFIAPITTQESFLNSIFSHSTQYSSDVFKNFEELIEDIKPNIKVSSLSMRKAANVIQDIDIESTIIASDEIIIPNARFLDNKVVMLLLEVSLIDQKKCSETNCDDKGKRLEFNLRPILINANKIDISDFSNTFIQYKFENLYLERFNVPQVSLINGNQVLNTFNSLINKTDVINEIDAKINNLYSNFQDPYFTSILKYSSLGNVKFKINEIIKLNKNKLHVQYVWDWLNDIVAAYNEILDFSEKNSLSFCCSKEYDSRFPFHILLGKIETRGFGIEFESEFTFFKKALDPQRMIARNYNVLSDNQSYVTPFIKISNKEKKNEKLILKSLLERLVLIIDNFSVLPNDSTYLDSLVKVTPSYLGDYPLSKKSIPYYYNKIPSLNRVWNPKETLKNTNNTILSYFSSSYSRLNKAVYPLNYDIEPYNFLRIEGIIGKNYKQVVQSLLTIKKNSQLPFNVIALNAINLDNVALNISNFMGEWGEIELNYDLIRRNWENVIGKSIEWLELNRIQIEPLFYDSITKVNQYEDFLKVLKLGRDSMVESFSDFVKIYKSFIATYESIELIAVKFREINYAFLTTSIAKTTAANAKAIKLALLRVENKVLIEDFIDHLDQIIMVCQKGEFRTLYQAAQDQWKKSSKDLTLSNFIEKHPGLEHKAGVTKGGTFVIVYQDNSLIPSRIIRKNIDNSTLVNKTMNKLVNENSTETASILNKSDVFDVTIEDYKKKIQAYASYYLPQANYIHLVEYMDNFISSTSIKEDLYGIPNQAVIADFYLPYICCSEGNSINFILGNDNPSGPADFDNPDFSVTDFKTNKPTP